MSRKMNDNYSIVNELNSEHFEQALQLSQMMWWSKDRTREEFETMLKHCIPFAVIENSTQRLLGFARVLTDEARYAYIYDVMVEQQLRGKGIGKLLMQYIIHHSQLSQVKYFELTCAPDMAEFYKHFGFDTDYKNVIAMRYTRQNREYREL